MLIPFSSPPFPASQFSINTPLGVSIIQEPRSEDILSSRFVFMDAVSVREAGDVLVQLCNSIVARVKKSIFFISKYKKEA